jgi:hypothetical protein
VATQCVLRSMSSGHGLVVFLPLANDSARDRTTSTYGIPVHPTQVHRLPRKLAPNPRKQPPMPTMRSPPGVGPPPRLILICSSPGNFTSQGLDQISNFFCLQQEMMGLSYSSLYQSNLRTLQFSVFYNYSTTQEVPLEHSGYGFVKFSFSMVSLN